MRLSLVLPAGLLVVAGAARSQETPPPDPLETGAWMKVLGLASGAADPVTLSEAEVNLLLGSAQLSSFFERQAGLSGLTAQLSADQVRLGGEMDGALLAGVLGPLAPPEGGPRQPFDVVIELRGAEGSGRAKIVRGAVAGFEAPPQLLNEAAPFGPRGRIPRFGGRSRNAGPSGCPVSPPRRDRDCRSSRRRNPTDPRSPLIGTSERRPERDRGARTRPRHRGPFRPRSRSAAGGGARRGRGFSSRRPVAAPPVPL